MRHIMLRWRINLSVWININKNQVLFLRNTTNCIVKSIILNVITNILEKITWQIAHVLFARKVEKLADFMRFLVKNTC